MEASRRQGVRDLAFVGAAVLVMLGANRLGSRDPQNLGMGLAIIIIAAWEIARGKASLLFRTVKKTDNPTLFWLAIFFMAMLGTLQILLSFVL